MNSAPTMDFSNVGQPFTLSSNFSRLRYRPWMTAIFCFAASFDFRLLQASGAPSFAVAELFGYVFILIWFADLVVARDVQFNRTVNALKANWALTIYSIWAMLASIVTIGESMYSFWIFRNLLTGIILYLAIVVNIRGPIDLIRCLVAWFLGGLVHVIFGLSQSVLGAPYPVPLNLAAAVKMDTEGQFVTNVASGLFNHPNGLAVYLIPMIIFTALSIYYCRRFYLLVILLIIGPAIGFVFFHTHAKGAWFWAAFGLCFGLVSVKFRAFLLPAVIVSLASTISGVTWISLYLGGSLKTMITRLSLWESAIAASFKDPYILAFGNGFRQILYASSRISDLSYPNAHNALLNQVVYFGLPGLIFYLSAFFIAINQLGRVNRVGLASFVYVFAIASLVALFGEYFFEPAAEGVTFFSQWAFILALAFIAPRMTEGENNYGS